MKALIFITSVLIFIGCVEKPKKSNLADINIIVTTNFKIDSLRFSDISQTKWYNVKSKDTMKLHLDKPLNDLYNFWFYTESGKIKKQVWLDGNKVIVKGILDKTFQIDSVINSKLYYESKNYVHEYNELRKRKSSQTIINNFMLEKINKNIHNPFSLALSNSFLYQNENNKEQILGLKNILGKHKNSFKNHFLNVDDRIESLLKIKNVNLDQYTFLNRNNDSTQISLSKNKFYLLDFWFVNCPPCVKQHIEIAKNLSFLKEKNIEIIGISKDENYNEWSSYLLEKNYTWQNYKEYSSKKRLTWDLIIDSYPTYYLISTEGKILSIFNSFSRCKAYIENNPKLIRSR